jgi:hypothetical protein
MTSRLLAPLALAAILTIPAGAQSVDARIAALEMRVAQLEARLNALDAVPATAVARPVAVGGSPIHARLVEKFFTDGRVQDFIRLVLEFGNTLQQPVRSFDGVAIFTNASGREIFRLDVTADIELEPGETDHWRGGIGFDPEIEGHVLLRDIPQHELSVEFRLGSVTYASGLREDFSNRS